MTEGKSHVQPDVQHFLIGFPGGFPGHDAGPDAPAVSLAVEEAGPVELEDRIAGFLDYLRVEKGLTANTVESYARDLEKFSRFLEKNGWGLGDAGPINIRKFLSWLDLQKLQSRTIARQIVTLRHFYRYLRREGFVASNPTENLESPRVWKILPKYLTVEEVELAVLYERAA